MALTAERLQRVPEYMQVLADTAPITFDRTALRVGEFRARLSDLLFVRAERMHIVQQKAIFGAPDLAVERLSPGDRRSDTNQREAAYRTIGVREMWLIDRPRSVLRVLRRQDDLYEEHELHEGEVGCAVLPPLHLRVEWLQDNERPPVHEVLKEFLS